MLNPLKTHALVAAALSATLTLGLTGCDQSATEPTPATEPAPATTTPVAGDNATNSDPKTTETTEPDGDTTAKAPAVDTSDFVEIELDLPPALFIGTPKEAPSGTTAKGDLPPREPLRAPKGTVNLAEGKPVTSSDEEPIIGFLDQVTDGDKKATDGSYVELGSGTQWVQIDLEEHANIYGIVIWHFHSESGRIYRDVVVQISNDPDFVEGVVTVFNNDDDNSSGLGAGTEIEYFESNEGHLIYVDGKTARYVRLYSKGSTSDDQNHYIEVEVYGVPVPQVGQRDTNHGDSA